VSSSQFCSIVIATYAYAYADAIVTPNVILVHIVFIDVLVVPCGRSMTEMYARHGVTYYPSVGHGPHGHGAWFMVHGAAAARPPAQKWREESYRSRHFYLIFALIITFHHLRRRPPWRPNEPLLLRSSSHSSSRRSSYYHNPNNNESVAPPKMPPSSVLDVPFSSSFS
jgi:hypothetical protein